MAHTDDRDLKPEIVRIAHETVRLGLNYATTGNVSVHDSGRQGLWISRSGSRLGELTMADLVFVPYEGTVTGKPSSELPIHRAVLHCHPRARAAVHCHAPDATAVSYLIRRLPARHNYMMLALGIKPDGYINVAPFKPPGSNELADSVVQALGMASACLLGKHGMLAVGATPREALEHALNLEAMCTLYLKLGRRCGQTPLKELQRTYDMYFTRKRE